MIRTEVLECGARLVTESMAEARSVTVGVWVGTGSRDEDDAHSGASHFLEHLLFKGTPKWSAADIAESVDEIGGDMNAFTTKEYTAFYIRLLADDLPLGLDVLGAIMTEPAPAGRRHRRRAPGDPGRDPDARRRARRLRGRAVHGGDVPRPSPRARGARHPAERRVARPGRDPHASSTTTTGPGTWSSPRRATSTTSAWRSRSTPASPGGPAGSRRPGSPPESSRARPWRCTTRPTEQVHLVVGMRCPGRHSPERWPLGGAQPRPGRGDLEPAVPGDARTPRSGLLDLVRADPLRRGRDHERECRAPRPSTPARCSPSCTASSTAWARAGITDRELAVAKGHLRAETLLSLEDSGARMSRIGSSLLLHGQVLDIDEVLAKVDAVTVDDVAAVAAPVGEPDPDLVGGRAPSTPTPRERRCRARAERCRRCAGPSIGFGHDARGSARRRRPHGPRGVPGRRRGPRARARRGRRPRPGRASTCAR